MEAKFRANPNGGGTTWVVDPRTGETVDGSTRDLEPGQEVTVTAINAHEANELEVGEVVTPEPTGGEQPAPVGEGAAEEPAE